MIAFFAFVVCMVACGVLLVAATAIRWQHARDVIRLTEQEAAEQRAREAGHENQEGRP